MDVRVRITRLKSRDERRSGDTREVCIQVECMRIRAAHGIWETNEGKSYCRVNAGRSATVNMRRAGGRCQIAEGFNHVQCDHIGMQVHRDETGCRCDVRRHLVSRKERGIKEQVSSQRRNEGGEREKAK